MGWFGRVFLSLSRARTTRELLRVLCCADTSHARGICLLREWLSPTQRAQFDSEGHFDVTGCDTGKRYRIRYGNASNVFELDENGNLGAGWCFAPHGTRVVGDRANISWTL